jgi:hypothetical protein
VQKAGEEAETAEGDVDEGVCGADAAFHPLELGQYGRDEARDVAGIAWWRLDWRVWESRRARSYLLLRWEGR